MSANAKRKRIGQDVTTTIGVEEKTQNTQEQVEAKTEAKEKPANPSTQNFMMKTESSFGKLTKVRVLLEIELLIRILKLITVIRYTQESPMHRSYMI